MRYQNDDIEKLTSKLDIVEVVGEYVELKKTGSNYKGLCPFHQDTNPSFIVSPIKGIYKCFVCGAGGNAIKFVKEYNKISYGEAITDLSKKYNINITPIKGNQERVAKNKVYYEILEKAKDFFYENIFSNSGRKALEYLNKRGMKPDFIKKNSLGYALNSWDGLYNYLTKEGYDSTTLELLGLVKKGDKGYYDTFRDRVTFPIYSPDGKVIGFGGRTMGDRKDIAKYLNSPETPLFSKGRNLYGIVNRGSSLRKKNYTLLMEGYMDVLAAHAHGFDVALAPLGTAFTSEQGELLKRYTSNVIIAFDMDNPGRVASEKAGLILKKYGFNIRVLELKNAKDPDEFLKKYGREEFLKAVRDSKEIFDFLYGYYVKEYDLSNFMAKQNFIKRFKEFFQVIETELEKSLYLNKLAVSLGMEKEIEILKKVLLHDNQPKPTFQPFEGRKEEEGKREGRVLKIDELEMETLKLSLKESNYFTIFKDKTIMSPFVQKILNIIDSSEEKRISISKLLKDGYIKLEPEEEEIILEISMELINQDDEGNRKKFVEIYKRWFIKEIDDKMNFYKGEMKMIPFVKCQQMKVRVNKIEVIEELEKIYEEFLKMEI